MLVVELHSRLNDIYACVQLSEGTSVIWPISSGYVSLLLRGWVIDDSFSEFEDFLEVARSSTFFKASMSNIFLQNLYVFVVEKDLAYGKFQTMV